MKLLHIVATPRGHSSNTIRVSNMLLEELYAKYDDLSVEVLDLFRVDLPAVAGENIECAQLVVHTLHEHDTVADDGRRQCFDTAFVATALGHRF